MKPDRINTKSVLIDLQYHKSLNAFEEFYGDGVSYQDIEQESYVEFKEIIFNKINSDIKFRKYGRLGQILTVKADMLLSEIELFRNFLEAKELKMVHDWAVTGVTIITDKLSCNKYEENEDDCDETEEND